MSRTVRRNLVMATEAGVAPEIAPWLWALGDARRRTLDALTGLTPAVLDWSPPAGGNSIGTLLYHIALIEADWLLAEVLELVDFPPEVLELFPLDVRDDGGGLTPCLGLDLATHLARLDATRERLLATFLPMSATELRRTRHLPAYDVTPEWVLHHLLQHEAEHRGEIGLIRALAARPDGVR